MMHESSVDLPDEIIELILSKCPVESILRFKSVSKSWQSIILGPCFMRIHRIQRSRLPEDKNKLFVWRESERKEREGRICLIRLVDKDFGIKSESLSGWKEGSLYLIRLDENLGIKSESVLGYPSYGKLSEPLCSCDGLILSRKDNDEHVLWNPLSRKHIIIPAFNPRSHPKAFANWPLNRVFARHCHLYHDSITDDYKIVFDYEDECYTVYSCKNGSWGEIKDFHHDWMVCDAGIDGCLYDRRDESSEIVCFDARDGRLHKFRQPEGVESLDRVKIKVVSGRLCLYGFSGGMRLHLWVMERNGSFDKSWRKLISMEEEEEEQPWIWDMRPVYFIDNDNVILGVSVMTKKYEDGIKKCYWTEDETFIYNPRSKSHFKSIGFSRNDQGEKYFSYSENLDMPCSNTIC